MVLALQTLLESDYGAANLGDGDPAARNVRPKAKVTSLVAFNGSFHYDDLARRTLECDGGLILRFGADPKVVVRA